MRKSGIRKFRITAVDGKTCETRFYNLDVILSVGYRMKSHRDTSFCIWAAQRLREFIVKGLVLDDERLEMDPGPFTAGLRRLPPHGSAAENRAGRSALVRGRDKARPARRRR